MTKEAIRITQSGTPEAIITFIAYPGERPVLDGGGAVGDLLILTQHASYLRISGFTLRNFNSWGMDLNGENRYVHLDHLTIEGGKQACILHMARMTWPHRLKARLSTSL